MDYTEREWELEHELEYETQAGAGEEPDDAAAAPAPAAAPAVADAPADAPVAAGGPMDQYLQRDPIDQLMRGLRPYQMMPLTNPARPGYVPPVGSCAGNGAVAFAPKPKTTSNPGICGRAMTL